MQRWLFFLFLTASGNMIFGSSVDILETELSFRFGDPTEQYKSISAQADLQLQLHDSTDSIFFLARGISMSEVRSKEGRLKEHVRFRRQGDTLWLYHHFPRGRFELSFDYQIRLGDSVYNRYVQKNSDFLAFNPFNIGEGGNLGAAGMFYPSLPGDESRLIVNITFPKGRNSAAPGRLDFITDNQDGTISHYRSSEEGILPEQFFLIVGRFEEAEEEELEEEFDFIALDLTKQKAEQVKPLVKRAVNYLDVSLSDSQYVRMDSVAPIASYDYFLKKEDVPDEGSRQFALEQWLFANYAGDSANDQFLDFYRSKKGDGWYLKLLQRHYEDSAYSRFFWEKYLDLFLQQSGPMRSLADTVMLPAWTHPYGNQFQPMVSIARQVYQRQAPLEVTAKYRYVANDKALYIYLSQPDSAVDVSLPIEMDVITSQENVLRTVMRRLRMSDTIRIELSESPKYVGTQLGYDLGALDHYDTQLNPVDYTQIRPDTYLLYELGNARNPKIKRSALTKLLETSNSSLFSTVLGIAMDDEDAELRIEALRQADNLDSGGQRKLKDTIKALAQNDPKPEVRQMAAELVRKYYTD